jgi:outer membrane protein OmpA-like peptidoglycan-associated protein
LRSGTPAKSTYFIPEIGAVFQQIALVTVWQMPCYLVLDMRVLAFAVAAFLPFVLLGQEPNPTQSGTQQPQQQTGPTPIFRVQVVSRSTVAISYRDRSGWTKVNFQGTSLAPTAKGTAEVNSRLGHMEIKLDIKALPPATTFGTEFLTYVLWAITPDGHAANLGEVVLDSSGKFTGDITTELQSFGLIITAEPYFAVRQPSDVVVMENVVRKDTMGKVEYVNAKYELLARGQYTYHVPESQRHPIILDSSKKSPLELYEAQNAVQIARYAKADQYGGDTYQDSVNLLSQAQDYATRKQWKPSVMTAKEAVQKAEDARIISIRRQQQLALDQERQEVAARQAAAQQQAAEDARQRQAAEQQAQQEAQQREAAERAKAAADAASAQSAADAQKAQQAATEADRLRQQAEAEKNALREQLLQQFNAVLQTRETPRGLVVNMSDVLFDTGKYTLKEPAREKLAKIVGIVISHPGLNLQVEGYTDVTGSDELNQRLSEQRADTVREFLVAQGINPQNVTAVGYGKNYPVASNDTREGRALNRRVELVISGEVIGIKIGAPPAQAQPPAPGVTPQPQ